MSEYLSSSERRRVEAERRRREERARIDSQPGVAPTSQLDNSIYSSGPMHDTSCDSSSSSSDGGDGGDGGGGGGE